MSLDFQLFELINQFAGKNSFIDQFVILFSKVWAIPVWIRVFMAMVFESGRSE